MRNMTFHTKLPSLDITIKVGQADVSQSSSVRDLGANLDQGMNLQPQVSCVVRGMYANLPRIGQIRHMLDHATCAIVTNPLVLTRLDYNKALLATKSTLVTLQLAHNAAARQVTRTKKCEHISSVLHNLYWLLVHIRVMYKILTLVHEALHGDGHQYLMDLLTIYRPT